MTGVSRRAAAPGGICYNRYAITVLLIRFYKSIIPTIIIFIIIFMTIILIKTNYIISFSIISKIIIKNTFIIIIKFFIIISIIYIIIIIMFIYITFNSKTKNASLIKTSVTISKFKTYFLTIKFR
jgi:hypothetical protein